MNKTELMRTITQHTALPASAVQRTLEQLFEVIIETLKQGQDIRIKGFGVFQLKERQARLGRNPKTGTTVQIPASKTMVFKPSKEVKTNF